MKMAAAVIAAITSISAAAYTGAYFAKHPESNAINTRAHTNTQTYRNRAKLHAYTFLHAVASSVNGQWAIIKSNLIIE